MIEELIESIRNLRDADFHVCPHEQYQDETENKNYVPLVSEYEPECTCEHFDRVIDKLEKLKDKFVND